MVVAQIDPKKLRKKQTVNISVSLRAFTHFVLREGNGKDNNHNVGTHFGGHN